MEDQERWTSAWGSGLGAGRALPCQGQGGREVLGHGETPNAGNQHGGGAAGVILEPPVGRDTPL